MKLWLLRPMEGLKPEEDPWKPWYDKAFGFVVRAETELSARDLASKEAYDETAQAWMNPALSTCVVLTYDGPAGIIIRDFAAA